MERELVDQFLDMLKGEGIDLSQVEQEIPADEEILRSKFLKMHGPKILKKLAQARAYPEMHKNTGHKRDIDHCGCPMAVIWQDAKELINLLDRGKSK